MASDTQSPLKFADFIDSMNRLKTHLTKDIVFDAAFVQKSFRAIAARAFECDETKFPNEVREIIEDTNIHQNVVQVFGNHVAFGVFTLGFWEVADAIPDIPLKWRGRNPIITLKQNYLMNVFIPHLKELGNLIELSLTPEEKRQKEIAEKKAKMAELQRELAELESE